jgi:tRNA(Glu) U13 pseudouridine synthase TruD
MGMELTRGDDELYPKRTRLTLVFELPRGAYATLVVKRLTLLDGPPSAP